MLAALSIRRRYAMQNEPEDKEKTPPKGQGITRRRFLKTVGSGAAVAAASEALTGIGSVQASPLKPEEVVRIHLLVNGRSHRLTVEARWSLLFVLREKLGLTGTKVGCERGECGACTVLMDGTARYSCMTLAVEAQGSEIITVEGLMNGEELGPVQQAFLEHDALQCGYCTPGQIMSAEGLLRLNPTPATDEIRTEMSGNLCRCGAYTHIFKAVKQAARLKK
jgi:xanthine dehydrogenase YagT iron-sulfur-binding subunit